MELNYENLKTQGNNKFKLGQYESAIKCYTDAIKLKEDEPITYSNRALCYINLRRFFEAKRDCDKAINLDPKQIKAYYRRAMALKELMRYQSALEDFLMVEKLDPDFPLTEKEIKKMERTIQGDKRIDFKDFKKPDDLLSKLPLKRFELNNQYSGVKNYN